jgi:tetratricopeptide (TPR) repeat protein
MIGAGCSKEAKRAKHLARASNYFEAGKFEEASIEYLNVLRLDPTNALAIGRLGVIYHDQGKIYQANALLTKAEQLTPDDLSVRLRLGYLYLSSGKFQEAGKEADFILSRDPVNEEALVVLAESAAKTNGVPQARRRLEELRPKSGNSAGFHLAQANLYINEGKTNEAQAEVNQALAANPKSSYAHVMMGNLSWSRRNLKEADEQLKLAADLAPWRSLARLRYANFKLTSGETNAGMAYLEEITKHVSDYLPAWMRLAQIAFAEKRFEDCSKLLEKIQLRDPVNPDAMMLKGRVYLAQGEGAKAVAELEKLNKGFPKNPAVLYYLAVAQLLNKDLSGALPNLNQAVAINPVAADAVLLLAELNLRKGDFTAAIISLNKLIERTPNIPKAYLILANAYRGRENFDDAFRVYNRLMELYPKSPETPLLIGLLYEQQKKPQEARKSFEKALELAPDYMLALEQLIDLDIADKNFSSALSRAQNRIDKNPQAALPHLLAAKVFMAQTNYVQAESALNRAIQLNPDARIAYMLLAQVYVDSKKDQQALEKLKDVIAKNPKDTGALMLTGMIHDKLKNYQAARDAYEKILEISPRYIPALNNLAYLYSEHLNDNDKAYEMARKVRDQSPNDPAVADTFGWILYKRGEYPWALSLLTESADKLPTNPEVLYHLAMAHYKMGEIEAAKFCFEQASQFKMEFPGRDEIEARLAVLNLDVAAAGPEAVRTLEEASKKDPDDPIVLSKLAALYGRNGQIQKAVECYESALKLNPKNASAMFGLARLYGAESPAKALELAKDARALAPNDPQITHTVGQLAYRLRDYKWANSLLQESARQLPDDAEVLYDLALSQYSLGRITEAVAAMKSALQKNPALPQAEDAKWLIELSELLSDLPKAQTLAGRIQQVLTARPNYLPALYLSARLNEHQGKYPEAKAAYELILSPQRFSQFVPAEKRLAILLTEKLADYDQAFDHALKAREAYPEDAEVAKSLGIATYQRHDYARAAQLLSESSRKLTSDGDLFYYLGLAQFNLNKKTEATKALQQAISLDPNASFGVDAQRILAELKE